jgi:hypothetical protein
MIIHLNLTKDHLKLVRFLNVEDNDDDVLTINKHVMLTLQTHILDDVATILGYRDKAIKGTEEDPDGSAYPDDVEKYLLDTYHYVSDNMFYIETLLHQRCMEGIVPGKYKAKDSDLLWEYEGN